jgi:hypothetical protein
MLLNNNNNTQLEIIGSTRRPARHSAAAGAADGNWSNLKMPLTRGKRKVAGRFKSCCRRYLLADVEDDVAGPTTRIDAYLRKEISRDDL